MRLLRYHRYSPKFGGYIYKFLCLQCGKKTVDLYGARYDANCGCSATDQFGRRVLPGVMYVTIGEEVRPLDEWLDRYGIGIEEFRRRRGIGCSVLWAIIGDGTPLKPKRH